MNRGRASAPQRIGHRIKFGKVRLAIKRIAAVEFHPHTVRVQQVAAQRAPEQVKPHSGLNCRLVSITPGPLRPASLNLADPLQHHFAIAPVRSAMQRQAHADGRPLLAGQQQAVTPEITQRPSLRTKRVKHAGEATAGQHRARQQVMALQAGIMVRSAPAVHRTKTKI